VTSSSLSRASQLSCRVSSSSCSSFFCSGVSEDTHFSLSNLIAGGSEAEDVPLLLPPAGFGAAKKDVRVPCLAFFGSEPASAAALRLRVDIVRTGSLGKDTSGW
jgi:hypothetical protein